MRAEASGPTPAREIFDAVAVDYDGPAQLFGLFQYRSWHRELVKIVETQQPPPRLVLDMCTGTGAIAAALASGGRRIVAADISRAMLDAARSRSVSAAPFDLVQADAQVPPFVSRSFDGVVFSFLLRYVKDVPQTIAAMASLVRAGGLMISLEFSVPGGPWRPLWLLYARGVLPAGLALRSAGWRRVGGFLGRSISDFDARWPLSRLEDSWRSNGFSDVQTRRLSLGGAAITWGTREV